MSRTTTATTTARAVDGQALLEALNFDRRMAGSIIAVQPDWKELLDSIRVYNQRRHVAHVVWQIRAALGKEDFDLAREISDGVN